MVNITKKVLEDEVKLLNKRNVKLVYMDKVYNLLFNNAVIFTGNAKETYIYLQGLKYGLKVMANMEDVSVKSDSFTALDYFKNKQNTGFIIEAQKEAKDTYYSQFKNKYKIKIENLTATSLYFTAKATVLTPNNIQMNGPVNVPLCCIKFNDTMSIDNIGKLILKAIDNQIMKEMSHNKDLTSDRLLWIDMDTLWYLGWSNTKMLTKKVDFKVI